MKVPPMLLLLLGALAAIPVATEEKTSVSYAPKTGAGQGRHIVLLAGDEEYRSEEGLPMLAKILSQRHGFKCTVLFSVAADGTIDPKNTKSLSDPSALDTADAVVMLLRFRAVARRRHGTVRQVAEGGEADCRAPDQHACLQRLPEGQPVGILELQQRRRLREARPRRDVADALGKAQVGGHPRRDRAGAAEPPGASRHHSIFGDTDVYEAYPPADATVLVRGIVLNGMTP